MRKLRGYEDRDILNIDQTPVWIEMPDKSTLTLKGTRSERFVHRPRETKTDRHVRCVCRRHKAVTSCVTAWVKTPTKGRHSGWKSGLDMCGAGKKSWADETSIKFWLNKLGRIKNQRKRMLVWDLFRGHLTESVKHQVRTLHNSDLCVIPGGCTSKLQPADVSWNRPFKSKLAQLYEE